MKIDFNVVVLDFDGKPIKGSSGELTFKEVAMNSLLTPVEGDEKNFGGAYKLYEVAKKLSNGLTDYAVEELALIKERVPKVYAPLIVGLTADFLEGEK